MFVCTEYLAHFGPFFNTYCAPFALIFFSIWLYRRTEVCNYQFNGLKLLWRYGNVILLRFAFFTLEPHYINILAFLIISILFFDICARKPICCFQIFSPHVRLQLLGSFLALHKAWRRGNRWAVWRYLGGKKLILTNLPANNSKAYKL